MWHLSTCQLLLKASPRCWINFVNRLSSLDVLIKSARWNWDNPCSSSRYAFLQVLFSENDKILGWVRSGRGLVLNLESRRKKLENKINWRRPGPAPVSRLSICLRPGPRSRVSGPGQPPPASVKVRLAAWGRLQSAVTPCHTEEAQQWRAPEVRHIKQTSGHFLLKLNQVKWF